MVALVRAFPGRFHGLGLMVASRHLGEGTRKSEYLFLARPAVFLGGAGRKNRGQELLICKYPPGIK